MVNEEKKYVSLESLSTFLNNIKENYALKEHNHKLSGLENDANFTTQEYVDNLFETNIQTLEDIIDESGVLDE